MIVSAKRKVGKQNIIANSGKIDDLFLFITFLHFKIFDRPGIIGKVGTILGGHSINIAGFGVSRHKSGEEVAFVSVDDPIGKDVLEEILKIDGMIEAKVIDL